ncbi:DUF305 domain-containing protein [Actinoplanes couchii]|uniref:DUF305 domain-containing protein n=1 Tax=Actinoplanes couchii TaxID=403638 RepID=A0ABQ3X144_9ACTN|nr:DUF305 domain-containing protein [Actinoplanes couchii]MDR6316632.1 uncharacterized protein (DUF305 family) [Actinoplanes couchii]GID52246.1 DUF305 domain-containing protein [Actinoplanes couchii]
MRPGPVARRTLALVAVLALLMTGACGGGEQAEAHNDTDVMFLQMGLAQIAEGDRIAQAVERRATDPEVRAVATELRGAWRTEAPMMRGWLQVWGKPMTAAPDQKLHAGHGDLHSLREEDFTGLGDLAGAEFDRAATALLLANLHNAMETIRMQAADGAYPQAVELAERMTESRQNQIQRLLRV